MRSPLSRVVGWMTLAAWTAFWFWAFSFRYSSSFFHYHQGSRIPFFAAALLAVVIAPWSAVRQWQHVNRARRSRATALLWHVGTVIGAAAVPAIVAAGVRAVSPQTLSGDEAMGVGIDMLSVLGVAGLTVIVLSVALVVPRRAGR